MGRTRLPLRGLPCPTSPRWATADIRQLHHVPLPSAQHLLVWPPGISLLLGGSFPSHAENQEALGGMRRGRAPGAVTSPAPLSLALLRLRARAILSARSLRCVEPQSPPWAFPREDFAARRRHPQENLLTSPPLFFPGRMRKPQHFPPRHRLERADARSGDDAARRPADEVCFLSSDTLPENEMNVHFRGLSWLSYH